MIGDIGDGAFDFGAMWKRIISFRGEMSWIVVGQAAAASGGIVGVKLLTHWLPPDAYGRLALGLTLATLVQMSIFSPFTGSSLRFYSAAQSAGELRPFLKALGWGMKRAALVVILLLLIGFVVAFERHDSEWIPILGWCSIFAFFSTFSATLDGMQNAARHRIVVAWHDGLGNWLRFLVGTVAVILFGARASNALAGYALAAILVFCSQFYFFKRSLLTDEIEPGPAAIEKWRKAIFSYGWPFATFGIFVWAQGASERWALQIFADSVQVGQYSVLFQLGYAPVALLGSMLMQLITPMIFQIAGDGNDSGRVRRGRRLSLILSLVALFATGVCGLVAYGTAPLLFSLMVPPPYWAVAHFLPLLVLSGGIFTTGQFASLALMSESSSKALVAPKISTAVLAVAFNAVGASMGGLRGVVIAGLSFSVLYTSWIFILSARDMMHLADRAQRGILGLIREA